MKTVQSYRASKILFNFLKSNHMVGTILLPANVCSEVPRTCLAAGLEVEFLDIDDTLCIDQKEVLSRVGDYVGMVFVRTYGNTCDYEYFFRECKTMNPDFIIVEDCCLAYPDTRYKMSKYVDISVFSLGGKKQVELGGGFAFVQDGRLYEDQTVDESEGFLTNELSNINFEEVDRAAKMSLEHKQKLNDIYAKNLPIESQLPASYQGWRFNILVGGRKQEILDALFSHGLFASSHYRSQNPVTCPNANKLQERIINLFNDFYYTEEQAIVTCQIINEILKKA